MPSIDDSRPSREEALAMVNERLEILTAVMAGLDRRTELMAVVEAAPDPATARRAVINLLQVSELGADAVLAMQVRRFTVREREKIRRELSEVEAERRKFES
jgi:DNA gyrase/topoisomerase IV subunit A